MKAQTLESTKKILLVIAVLFFLLGCALSGCSDRASEYAQKNFKEIAWPTSGVGSLIPTPSNLFGEVITESADYFSVEVSSTEEEFESYINECIDAGFSVDYSKSTNHYSAQDSLKNDLSIFYNTNYAYMDISISSYEQEANSSSSSSSSASTSNSEIAKNDDSKKSSSGKSKSTGNNKSSSNGIDPEFKEAVDSYEDFFDEYVSFMKKYSKSNNPASLALDYAKFTSQYATTMKKMEDLEKDDLTPQEEKYYLDALTRINNKLSEVSTGI